MLIIARKFHLSSIIFGNGKPFQRKYHCVGLSAVEDGTEEDGFVTFAPYGSKLRNCRHPAGGKQGSTGALYLIVRILTSKQNKTADTERYQLFCGGGGRIRTIEAKRSRFTVCPLWPLGNSPI